MAFRVDLAPRAVTDLDAIAEYIKQSGSFEQAENWFNGAIHAIASLKNMPSRCSVADESEELGREVRFLLYGSRNRAYKVYFSIHHETPSTGAVRVFHVRHWARKGLDSGELQGLVDESQGAIEGQVSTPRRPACSGPG